MDVATATLWVSGTGLVLGGVTLYVVVRQLGVMRDQAKLESQQLDIIEKQDRLLARRSNLLVEAQVKEIGGGAVRIDFNAYNTGEKAATGYFWHLLLPPNEVQANLIEVDGRMLPQTDVVEMDSVHYRHYEGFKSEPLYPTRRRNLGIAVIQAPQRAEIRTPFKVWWQMIGEDGNFPSAGDMASIQITLPTLT